jgi:hypothetical protein
VNLRELFKKGHQDCVDGQEKEYNVNQGKADIHPLSKFFVFVPLAVTISCLTIMAAVFSAPTAMDFVKNGLDGIIGHRNELKSAAPENLFSDVSGDSKYFDSLTYLKRNGIISGYADGTFLPDLGIKRAELVKTLVAAKKQFPLALNYNNCFKDVKNEWFAPSVCFAKSSGWISGYADGTFHPNDDLSRGDAMNTLVKAFKLEQYPEDLVGNDQTDGDTITRGEAFQMLYRVLQL